MGGVSVGDGGHGGKKSVDSEIPLVPFIDLLLCCIMFLLVTAVWNKLARLEMNQQQPGRQGQIDQQQEERVRFILQITNQGYRLSAQDGTELPLIEKVGDRFDLAGLREKLRERRQQDPNRRDIIITPEDGVIYADVVAAMDIVVGEQFTDMSLSAPN